jgi:hypothetical protein
VLSSFAAGAGSASLLASSKSCASCSKEEFRDPPNATVYRFRFRGVGDVELDLRAGAAGRGKVRLELEDCCLPALRDVLDVELCVEADIGGRIEAG